MDSNGSFWVFQCTFFGTSCELVGGILWDLESFFDATFQRLQ